MATAKSRRTTAQTTPILPSEEVITITQVIGMVVPDDNVEVSMLVVAYRKAAEFIQENAGDQEIMLTWTYGGGTFHATYEPPARESKNEEVGATYAREY